MSESRMMVEQESRNHKQHLRDIFSLTAEGIIIHESGLIVDANQAAAALAGFHDPGALIGRHILRDMPFTSESKQFLQSYLCAEFLDSRSAELVLPDGSRRRILVRGRAMTGAGNGHCRILFFQDLTDLSHAEQALRDTEAKFRAISMSTPEALILINGDGLIEYWNPAAERIFGYSASEAQGREVHSMIMPEAFATQFENAFQGFRATGGGFTIGRNVERTAIRKDGKEFPVEIAVSAIPMNGEYWSSALIRDISDRKRVEEERSLNARRLSALLDLNRMSDSSLPDLVHFAMEAAVRLTRSSIGYIAFANEDETELTMYAWSKTAMNLCAIEDKPIRYRVESTGLWGEAIRQRRPIITNDYSAGSLWKKGVPAGHVRIIRHMNVPVFKGDRIVLVAGVGNKPEEYDEGDVRQLTLLMEGMQGILDQRRAEEEKARLQEQLAQASKMEAIGRLAGGVAHDFNNLLTTILGYSELILEQLTEQDPVRSEIDEIRKAGRRAAALTQQLLTFSRKQVIRPRIIDLNSVVKETRGMLEPLLGENIELLFDLDPCLGRIKIDPHQIDQVLLNLAVNSRDAMPDGGTLTIATANVEFDCGVQRPPEIASGSYISLAVADTGIGMSDDVKSRLFEPFFSTKEMGKGTGLGLATVYGIVKQNGGSVVVSSAPGLGTVFMLYFPRTDEKPDVPAEPETAASPTGKETILLVEDSETVRQMTYRILSGLGYEVLPACDGTEAIHICNEYPERIHLLLSDVAMPGINGFELYEQLRKIRPGMQPLFMSGYAGNIAARQGILPEGMEFIQKPFDIDHLASRIRQLLEDGK